METLEESTAMVVIVEAAAEVKKRERDIAELVGEAFAREQVISEQRQQIAELAASAAAHEKIPPSMCIAALGMWSAWGLKTTSAMRAVNNVAEIRLLRGIRLRMSVSPWEADAKMQQQKSTVQGMRD